MGLLVSKPMFGLANRLLALTSMQRLADRYGHQLYLDWHPTEQCMAEFTDLFSASLPKAKLAELPPDFLRLETFDFGTMQGATRISNVIDERVLGGERLAIQSHSMLVSSTDKFRFRHLFYNGYALEMEKYFTALGLSPVVSGILDSFSGVDFGSMVGVHIRRPPPVTNPSEEAFAIPSDSFYERVMANLLGINPNLRFYLSTNGIRTEEYFKQRFGDRVLCYPKRSIDHQREAVAVQDALIDMLLLSRSRLLLRYEPSTFAYFSGLIGCKPQLLIGTGPKPEALPLRLMMITEDAGEAVFSIGNQRDLVALLTAPAGQAVS